MIAARHGIAAKEQREQSSSIPGSIMSRPHPSQGAFIER
jgi:hypothetical protein